jgi:Uma2 family endonuclease
LELDDGLSDRRPRVELANGRLEVLPMPLEPHELIMVFLFKMLTAFTEVHAPGLVMPNGIKIRVQKTGKWKFRLPDVLFLKRENYHLRKKPYWDGADLVMEVVSGGKKDRERDLITKIEEYAAAGISEYWIIDPKERFIRVLTLRGTGYVVHGEFRPGEQATSVLLPGFFVSVDDVLASASA